MPINVILEVQQHSGVSVFTGVGDGRVKATTFG
jgi:hypothetical protein